MKILLIFCDMLRANLLKTFNSQISRPSLMDSWLERLGGTVFTNCYSPAPDTPRSLACLYTGLYPKYNGCETRIQWPGYFLKKNVSTIFDVFDHRQYSMISCLSNVRLDVGILPINAREYFSNYLSLDALIKGKAGILSRDNLLVFLDLADYHKCVDDYGGLPAAHYRGDRHLSNSLQKVFSAFDKDIFDYIIIFSDHGCKLVGDPHFGHAHYLLNDDRSKVVMFVQKRGDYGLKRSDAVTSVLDVYPTVNNILNIKDSSAINGISLFQPKHERMIALEDHSIFLPRVGCYHDIWGVRSPNHFYLESLDEWVLLSAVHLNKYQIVEHPDEALLAEYRSFLSEYTCSYAGNIRQRDVLQLYKKLKAANECYSDGEKRPGKERRALIKLWGRFRKLLARLRI